jgi:hypothetical protein
MSNYTSSNSTISGIMDTTNGTFMFNSFGETTIDSFEFKETSDGNFIEVIKRQKSNPTYTLAVWPPKEPGDRVFKEIYGITRGEDGKKTLRLIRTIEGLITPGHYVKESVEFPE